LSARPDKTVAEAAVIMKNRKIGILMVAEESGEVVGVLSERDIVNAVATYSDDASRVYVSEIMTKRMIVCRPIDDATSVMKTMQNGRFRHMPVMDEGAFVGIISIGDILQHLLAHDQLEYEQTILSNF
jgi:CBS domain-containing protein